MVIVDVNHAATDNDVVMSGFSGWFPMSDNIEVLKEHGRHGATSGGSQLEKWWIFHKCNGKCNWS